MLLVPKNDTNLRNSIACSLLCLDEPIQKVASAPSCFLMSSSFLLTSLRASSHVIFCHLPPTSFIGDFRRCECSCTPCSRIEAPFAQCAPRLIGESNTGSCRIHTPFCTTASMEQPTEQWVQIVRLTSSLAPAASCAASAFSTMLNGSWVATAPAPSATPERCRKARRSIVRPSIPETERASRLCAAETSVDFLVSSMACPLRLWSCCSTYGCAPSRGSPWSRSRPPSSWAALEDSCWRQRPR